MASGRDPYLDDILDQIEDLGYSDLVDTFAEQLAAGFGNQELQGSIRVWVQEIDQAILPRDSAKTFCEGLQQWLQKNHCPHTCVISDTSTFGMQTICSIVGFILSELQSVRMLRTHSSSSTAADSKLSTPSGVVSDALLTLAVAVVTTVTTGASSTSILVDITQKIANQMKLAKIEAFQKLLVSREALSAKQLAVVEDIFMTFAKDFSGRRQLLLHRLTVTVQSFLWSPRVQGKEAEIRALVTSKMMNATRDPKVHFNELFLATEGIFSSQKVTGADVKRRTHSSVKRAIIGQVPDRGGRTRDVAAKDMPTLRARQSDGADWKTAGRGGRGRGGHGGSSRGGRGGHSDQGKQKYDADYMDVDDTSDVRPSSSGNWSGYRSGKRGRGRGRG